MIPILMYHSIDEENEVRLHPYYRTVTAPTVFMQHMEYLHTVGYRTITAAHAVRLLQSGGSTEKCAVVTFDDGYADFYTKAFPTMTRYGFTATVFLPTDYIYRGPGQFKGKDCLTWYQIRELHRHGITFGSHTATHPQLSVLDASSVKDEIVNSKKAIEDQVGAVVDSFAYPYAFPDGNVCFVRTLRDLLVEAGYRQGVSTRIGRARFRDDCYFLPRLPMNSMDDLILFRAKLAGSYDWLHLIQSGSKRLKSWLS